MARALAEQAARMAARVRDGLSEPPGRCRARQNPGCRAARCRKAWGRSADGLQAVVGSSDPTAVSQELGTVHMPARPFLMPVAAGMGEEVARGVAKAMVDAFERRAGRRRCSSWRTRRQAAKLTASPIIRSASFSPVRLRTRIGTHNTVRRLQDLGHISRSELQESDGKDGSLEEGADPVESRASAPVMLIIPDVEVITATKTLNPQTLKEVFTRTAQRNPEPRRRAWYGKNANGDWYQSHEDNMGGAHYARYSQNSGCSNHNSPGA